MTSRRRIIVAFAILGSSFVAPGCVTRDVAYPFRAPLVSSVRAARLSPVQAGIPASGRDSRPAAERAISSRRAEPAARRPAATPSPETSRPAAPRRSLIPSPIPSMTPRVGEAAAVDGIAGTLQAMVGQRETGSDSLGFALRALAAIGIDVTSQPGISALESVDELLVAAGSSDAVDATGLALPGDLVIFGDPDEPRSLSLVGVVAAVHPRGDRTEPCAAGATAACPTSPAIQTLEFVVLDRGVVRRGYLTPAAPDRARDSQGRVLNTFIRPLDRGTSMQAKFLAGELLRAVIRSERL